ncbi:Hypothetical protein AA314_09329 [Archangium gephyra]|uniref:Uncharacterized protein n=1 Tax=Archangium gephyra TaxID=48 RepID=A0AAC8QHQ8_9BACT|nr:Hypothetical protein AA314_09329 [Archangium gephyra]
MLGARELSEGGGQGGSWQGRGSRHEAHHASNTPGDVFFPCPGACPGCRRKEGWRVSRPWVGFGGAGRHKEPRHAAPAVR